MKTLHINQQNKKGGTAQIANLLVDGLNAGGVKSELWYFSKKAPDSTATKSMNPWVRRSGDVDFRTRIADMLCGANMLFLGGTRNPFLRNLLKDINGYKPDIVHLHNLHGGWADLDFFKELSQEYRTVVTLHDEWFITGHCCAIMGCQEWKNNCHVCPDLKRYAPLQWDLSGKLRGKKKEFLEGLARHKTRLVSPSKWLKESFIESNIWQGPDITVIPHGIDLSKFTEIGLEKKEYFRKKWGIPVDKKVLIYVADGGSDNVFKDFNTLKRALERFKDNRNRLFLIIVGDKLDKPALTAINEIPVLRMGYLDHQSLFECYSASDLFVYPSKADTFALVVAEAMAVGLPVIASCAGAIPELICDGEDGFLVDQQSPEGIFNIVNHVLDETIDIQKIIRNAKEKVQSLYGHERMVSAYCNLYSTMLD